MVLKVARAVQLLTEKVPNRGFGRGTKLAHTTTISRRSRHPQSHCNEKGLKVKHDPVVYRAICTDLDRLFKQYGDKAGTAITRYMRIRRQTKATKARIDDLENELGALRKVETLSRKKA